MGQPVEPPNYRPCEISGQACGDCKMGWSWDDDGNDNDESVGHCWGYAEYEIESGHVCDSWTPEQVEAYVPGYFKSQPSAQQGHIDGYAQDEEDEDMKLKRKTDKSDIDDARADGWTPEELAWAFGLDALEKDELVKAGSGSRNTKERKEMAGGKKGTAMQDGSYPIGNADELKKAIRAIGRGTKNSKAAIKAHIKAAASKLGLTGSLPDSWSTGKAEILVPIWKADSQQIIYGVVLEPELHDSQDDIVSADEIEKAAHRFLVDFRKTDVHHDGHQAEVDVIESYIAPQDLEIEGQQVQKGA